MTGKNLSGIDETMRGFVGRRGIKFDYTNEKKRPRMRFDLAAGDNNLSLNKIPTWRHCVCYDHLALKMKRIRPGMYVIVSGWVKTEPMLDEYCQAIRDLQGNIRTIEYLICRSGEFHDHKKLQPALPLVEVEASS